MLVEDLIAEIEDLVKKLTNGQLIDMWNKLYPEEELFEEEAGNYTDDVMYELRYMILDDLEAMELPFLIEIHNDISEEEIFMDDIMANGFDDEDFDMEED
jgi:hypothetical protein